MSSNSEFLDRYSSLTPAQLERVVTSSDRVKRANKRTLISKASPKLPDYGCLGTSIVGSDGIRR